MKDKDFKSSINKNMFDKDIIFGNILEKIEEDKLQENLFVLLLLLIAKEDTYGFDLVNKLDLLLKKELKNKEGTIYPILHSLENKKFITSYWVEGNISKKYYRISRLGKSQLKEKKSIVDFLRKPNSFIYTEEF
ncbi:MAG: PadR family transcriptional regulator [Sarcina sp.]